VVAEQIVHLPPGAAVIPQTPEDVGILEGDVQPHPLFIEPDSLKEGAVETPFAGTILVSGGIPPYRVKLKRSFRLSYGSLRPRLPRGFHLKKPKAGVKPKNPGPRSKPEDANAAAQNGALARVPTIRVPTLQVEGQSLRAIRRTLRVYVSDASTPKQRARRQLILDIRGPTPEKWWQKLSGFAPFRRHKPGQEPNQSV
jgi:hypothetical protein